MYERSYSLLLTLAAHHGHALSQVWHVLLGAVCGMEIVTVWCGTVVQVTI